MYILRCVFIIFVFYQFWLFSSLKKVLYISLRKNTIMEIESRNHWNRSFIAHHSYYGLTSEAMVTLLTNTKHKILKNISNYETVKICFICISRQLLNHYEWRICEFILLLNMWITLLHRHLDILIYGNRSVYVNIF